MPPTIVFDLSVSPIDPIRHILSWATDIIITRDRHEQRRSLRRLPHQTLQFTVDTVEAFEMARLDSLLQAGSPDGFKVPVWCDRYILPASVAASATTVTFTTAGYDFDVGEQAMFYQHSRSYELVTLNGVSPTAITFPATANTWPAGTALVPLKPGYLIAPMGVTRTFRDGQNTIVTFALT